MIQIIKEEWNVYTVSVYLSVHCLSSITDITVKQKHRHRFKYGQKLIMWWSSAEGKK